MVRAFLAFGLIGLFLIRPAYAAPTDLDDTFGNDGVTVTDFGREEQSWAVAIQPNGDSFYIVVAGRSCPTGDFDSCDFLVSRFGADGSLDTSFGVNGKAITDMGGDASARVVTIQNDGKIVAAGSVEDCGGILSSCDQDFALARYLKNGGLDNTFDGNGKLNTGFGDSEHVYAAALQPDGTILAAGYQYSSPLLGDTDFDFAVARYHPGNGSLDKNFDGDGKALTGFGEWDQASAVIVQPDEKVIVAGTSGHGMALARYNQNGGLDNAFGEDGKLTKRFGAADSYDKVQAVAPVSGGGILVGGSAKIGTTYDFIVARFTSTGALDGSFGSGGRVLVDFQNGSDSLYALKVQDDGKILAVGCAGNKLAMARLGANGPLDETFGEGGKSVSPKDDSCPTAVAFQPDGKVVAVKWTKRSGGDFDLRLARHRGASVPLKEGLVAVPFPPAFFHPVDIVGILDPKADLSLSVSDMTDPVLVGNEFAYKVTLRNDGPDAAVAVAVHLQLPAELTVKATTLSSSVCSGTNTVTCSLDEIPAGAVYEGTITMGTSSPGSFTATGSVASDTTDPVTANNNISETTTVEETAAPPAPPVSDTPKDAPAVSPDPKPADAPKESAEPGGKPAVKSGGQGGCSLLP